MTRTIQRFGWKPSLPDFRDLQADTAGLGIQAEVDPRPRMPRPYDQLQLGSCTGNAVAGAFEYDRILDGSDFMPSRLAIYWFERLLEGSPATADTGAYGRDGFKALMNFGAPPEKDIPYTDDVRNKGFYTDPRRLARASEFVRLTKPYRAVTRSASQFRQVLSNEQTIAFGFSVYESFESTAVARTGIMPVPTSRESLLGGHEVLMVGYLKKYPDHALCRTSWGEDWGLGGYFLMPWKVLLDPKMSSDFRTIVRSTI
jgi:C1A family cysteine protease